MENEQLANQVKALEEKDAKAVEGELLTEVTSVAAENSKGANIPVPNPEELVERASQSFIGALRAFRVLFAQLSTKQKIRTMLAVMDLPQDKIPVLLKEDVEKQAFLMGQRAINARFTITYYHIVRQIEEQRAKQAEEQAKNETGTTSEVPAV